MESKLVDGQEFTYGRWCGKVRSSVLPIPTGEVALVESRFDSLETNLFLLSERVQTLSSKSVAALPDESLLDVFRAIRWPEGTTHCPSCTGAANPHRALTTFYVCPECGILFNDVSYTIFARHGAWISGLGQPKLIRQLLTAIACFFGADRKTSLAKIGKKIGCRPNVVCELRNCILRLARFEQFASVLYRHGMCWTVQDDILVVDLIKSMASPEEVSTKLGRSVKAAADRAKETCKKLGIVLPSSQKWRPFLAHVYRPRLKLLEPHYVPINPAAMDRDFVRGVDALLPQSLPAMLRNDVCQEIVLALLEGRTSLEALRRNDGHVRWFIREAYKRNFENDGRGVLVHRSEDETRSNDEIASSIHARDWTWEEMTEERAGRESSTTGYAAPTQLGDVFERQIMEYQRREHARGCLISFDEAYAEVEASRDAA